MYVCYITMQSPEIDSSSDEGIIPDEFDSTIEFKNVSFSYPTRADIQASIEPVWHG